MRAAYDTLVALHVVSAVVGFGSIALSGAYGALARTGGSEAEVRRYFSSRGRQEYLILGVPVFGAAAMGVRPGGSDFTVVWVVAGFAIWLAAAALLLWAVRPAEEAVRAGSAGAGSRLLWGSVGSDVLFAVALVLMVIQPR